MRGKHAREAPTCGQTHFAKFHRLLHAQLQVVVQLSRGHHDILSYRGTADTDPGVQCKPQLPTRYTITQSQLLSSSSTTVPRREIVNGIKDLAAGSGCDH